MSEQSIISNIAVAETQLRRLIEDTEGEERRRYRDALIALVRAHALLGGRS